MAKFFPFRLGICNPIGTILSAALLLRYSLNMEKEAIAVEKAVEYVLDVVKMRTKDLDGDAKTSDVGDAVVSALDKFLF